MVNIAALNVFDNDTTVTRELLLERRIIGGKHQGLKVLGDGTLTKKLTVKADKFSASAKQAIESAGGVAEVAE